MSSSKCPFSITPSIASYNDSMSRYDGQYDNWQSSGPLYCHVTLPSLTKRLITHGVICNVHFHFLWEHLLKTSDLVQIATCLLSQILLLTAWKKKYDYLICVLLNNDLVFDKNFQIKLEIHKSVAVQAMLL